MSRAFFSMHRALASDHLNKGGNGNHAAGAYYCFHARQCDACLPACQDAQTVVLLFFMQISFYLLCLLAVTAGLSNPSSHAMLPKP